MNDPRNHHGSENTRPPQWQRLHDYIMEHGCIERRIAANVDYLEIYELSSRIGDAERALNIKYVRQEVKYTNSWNERRHFTRYWKPGTVLKDAA